MYLNTALKLYVVCFLCDYTKQHRHADTRYSNGSPINILRHLNTNSEGHKKDLEKMKRKLDGRKAGGLPKMVA